MATLNVTDGPTSIFLAGKWNMGWLNVFGLIIVILLLIPNMVYAANYRDVTNKCTNKVMNILEQIGRYGCMFLMVFHIGIAEDGFSSIAMFLVYLIGNAVLMLSYWVVWMMYFIKPKNSEQVALAVIPTLIFLLSGITMGHYVLIAAGIIFGIAHIYVTYQNRQE